MGSLPETAQVLIKRSDLLLREKVHSRVAREHAFQLNHMCSDKRYSAWDFAENYHHG